MGEKPEPKDVVKRKRGPPIRFHDKRHKQVREAVMRMYYRKKYEAQKNILNITNNRDMIDMSGRGGEKAKGLQSGLQRAHALKRRGPVKSESHEKKSQETDRGQNIR